MRVRVDTHSSRQKTAQKQINTVGFCPSLLLWPTLLSFHLSPPHENQRYEPSKADLKKKKTDGQKIKKKKAWGKKTLWLVASFGQEHHSLFPFALFTSGCFLSFPSLLACVCVRYTRCMVEGWEEWFALFSSSTSRHINPTQSIVEWASLFALTQTHIPTPFLVPCRTDWPDNPADEHLCLYKSDKWARGLMGFGPRDVVLYLKDRDTHKGYFLLFTRLKKSTRLARKSQVFCFFGFMLKMGVEMDRGTPAIIRTRRGYSYAWRRRRKRKRQKAKKL